MITSFLKQLVGSGLAFRLKCQNGYLDTAIVDFSLVLAFSSDVRHFKDDIVLVTVKLAINGDIDALVDLKREILACIRAVADPEHQMLLEQRYLCFQPWERIAESLGYSINNIYRMHSKALSEVTVPKVESFEQ